MSNGRKESRDDVSGPNKIKLREYPIPEIPPNGGLVAVERVGV